MEIGSRGAESLLGCLAWLTSAGAIKCSSYDLQGSDGTLELNVGVCGLVPPLPV